MNVHIGFNPVIAQVGPVQLSWHGLLTALAVTVAVWLGLRIARARGFPDESLWRVAVWGVVGGLVGARTFHVLDHLPSYLDNPASMLAFWQGGMAVYGGFIGGIAGGWLAARLERLPTWPLLDAAAQAMLVGQAIGRLGCLANGDAWGAPCGPGAWPLCLTYTHPNALLPTELLGVPTQPYALYEILLDVGILAALWLGRRRLAHTPGATFLLATLGYAATRFGLSYLRQETVLLWGLQEAQIVALITAAIATALLWRQTVSTSSLRRT